MGSLGTPNLRPSSGQSQGLPRVHSHIAPRGAVSLPATPPASCISTPTRTPQPPSIVPQSIRQQAPTPGQATPRRLDFADTPAQPIPRVPLVSPPAISYPPPGPPAGLPFANRFPIAHALVPKHHLRCSPLGGRITNRSSTTFLLQSPPAQLRSHWPLRVSANLIT
jgi:hypothetical protein